MTVRVHMSFCLAAGISLKTMELYFVVFCARYIDLLPFVDRHHNYHSWFLEFYLPVMKLAYISISGTVVYFIRFKEPYDFPPAAICVGSCSPPRVALSQVQDNL